ncbi:hypothetical protein NDU88_005559 [Pleurodeles waltl]|uniref:Uncharacterized protein n=1 Tax=Pleurodeles waltl TaxID=8319 RepID=A0AAV7MEZ4_PLEWA|nr:hypothetical protein NDU88_005559 [Pleurodeles waltl]
MTCVASYWVQDPFHGCNLRLNMMPAVVHGGLLRTVLQLRAKWWLGKVILGAQAASCSYRIEWRLTPLRVGHPLVLVFQLLLTMVCPFSVLERLVGLKIFRYSCAFLPLDTSVVVPGPELPSPSTPRRAG